MWFTRVAFLAAKGVNIGSENVKLLEENGLIPFIPKARYLLLRGAPVETPVDFKVISENKVVNSYLGDVKGLVMDIGEQTASIYEELLKEAETVVMRGPAGVIEKEEFRAGTLRLLNAALNSKGFVLIAGGHLSAMAQYVEQPGKMNVSTAGNSLLLFLSGEELPAFKALELSAKMFLGW